MRTRVVAIAALFLTWLFFFEYRSPFRRVHIPYDLEGFHYPLLDYASQAIHEGRFPEWDPTMYCGLPFAANVQAALFYPPTWLLFAANAGCSRLRYGSLQDFVLLHIWLAFVLCFLWLRWRRFHPLACALAAAVFAYSGYMMTQLQHLGLVAGFAWWPFGFWGIDQASDERRWRPLWKLAVASAFVFLAGYTPFWAVFAFCAVAYAAGRAEMLRAISGTVAALACSLLISAVQLFPAVEASQYMVQEARYGFGLRDPRFFASYLMPNFHQFGLDVPVDTNPGLHYWYLGAAGLVGICFTLFSRSSRQIAPALSVAMVTALLVTNPFDLISAILSRPSVLSLVIRDWYFIAGFTAAATVLAAIGLHHLFSQKHPATPMAVSIVSVVIAIGWCIRLIVVWNPGGVEFSHGLASLCDVAVTIVLFATLALLYPRSDGRLRSALGCALLLVAFVEFKAFGTSKRFNAAQSSGAGAFSSEPLPGLDPAAYRQMVDNPEYRVVRGSGGPFTTELRHAGLTTPQGFDPLLPSTYKKLVEKLGRFVTDREFVLDPTNREALSLLGVRYILTAEYGADYAPLQEATSAYRLLGPSRGHLRGFELTDARPVYGWDSGDSSAPIRRLKWTAEHRSIAVSSTTGGRFRLSEQFYPGWMAFVDGQEVPIIRCHEAFQCIDVPAGQRRVEFRFRSSSLRLGAWVSLLSILTLGGLLRRYGSTIVSRT